MSSDMEARMENNFEASELSYAQMCDEIESLRAKVKELERQLKIEIELSDSLKMASRMPGTGNYVAWIKEIRSSHDKLTAEQSKVKVLTDALKELVKLKALKDSIELSDSCSEHDYRWQDYQTRKPRAWAAAKEALATVKGE